MRIVNRQSKKTKGALIYKSESFHIMITKFFSYQVHIKGMIVCISWIYSTLIYGTFNFLLVSEEKGSALVCTCIFLMALELIEQFSRNSIEISLCSTIFYKSLYCKIPT
jgi:hypothetical protein